MRGQRSCALPAMDGLGEMGIWGVPDFIEDAVGDAAGWIGDKAGDAAGAIWSGAGSVAGAVWDGTKWVGDKASGAGGWVWDGTKWVADKAYEGGRYAVEKHVQFQLLPLKALQEAAVMGRDYLRRQADQLGVGQQYLQLEQAASDYGPWIAAAGGGLLLVAALAKRKKKT